MSETVYTMMMKLGLEHAGVMTGLTAIGIKLTGLHDQVTGLNTAFKNLGLIAVGGVMMGSIVHMMNSTKALNEELVKLKLQGGPMEAFVASGAARKLAFDIQAKVGLKPEDVTKLEGINYSLFGTEGLDPEFMKKTAQAQWVLGFQKDYKGDFGEDMKAVMRSGEASGRFTDPLTGKIDPKLAEHFYSQIIQAIVATHGMVNPQTVLGLTKQGGFSLRGLTDEGFATEMIMAQVLGGPRVGTATLGIYQQMAKGQMTQKTAQALQDVGQLKPDEWSSTKGGITLTPEASKRLTAKFAGDPMALSDEIMKNLDERGITDPGERLRLWTNAFGRQTTQRYEGEMATNYNQILSERARMMQGAGLDKAGRIINDESIAANMKKLENAWHALMEAVAGPNSENYIKVLQSITSAINSMSASILSWDPKTLEFIGAGIAAIGAALIGTGAAALLAAIGPTGWLIAAFATLAAINWDKLQGIAQFVQTMSGILRKIDEWSSIKIPRWMQWNANPEKPPFDPNLIGPQKQSFLGAGPGGAQLIPANFNPSNQKQMTFQHTTNMNIDGRSLAQVVSEVLEDLYQHPTGSPSPDGLAYFRPQGQFSST
jgi:hypothetical protein